MRCTDACVYPYPAGDSSLRRMALTARELGFDSIVAAVPAGGNVAGIEVIPLSVHGRGGSCGNRALVAAQATDYAGNRALIQSGHVRIIRGIQSAPRNSFDHVLSRLAAEKGVAVDIDISAIVFERGQARQRAIQRYAEIARFAGKFGFSLTFSSGARSVLGMRSPREMVALGALFGLDREDVRAALGAVSALLFPESPVEVVG
ncbi:MAG: RNase P subunit p30 family protein [Methanolinea sp.]|nr:RNase P subunit p30 family protein [Methanolinea sp.]